MFKSMEKFSPYVPLILRVIIGVIFFVHGFNKIKDPSGFIGFMEFLQVPLPFVAGWFITLLELLGGLALIVGVATRIVALLLAIEMVVAILIYKLPIGLIGATEAGYELDLALLAGTLALVLLGSGALSLERNVLKREL